MKDLIRGIWRRIEDYFFVLSLNRIQSWRKRPAPATREQEEVRRAQERFDATHDRSASF